MMNRRITGHRNRAQGHEWEATIERWHDRYRRLGRAHVVKTGPPVGGKPGALHYTGPAPPDYMGTLDGGRSLVFEAKSTTSLPWAYSELKDHQAADLEKHSMTGALAFVLLRVDREWWYLPWRTLAWPWQAWSDGRRSGRRADRGTASLARADLEAIGVRLDERGWLPEAEWWINSLGGA